MREFELYGTVRAVVSVCDSMNYITDEEDLLQVFRLVSNYLDPGGVFIFDLNTEYKYRNILGDSVIAENREDCSFIWENDFDEEEGINEYDLTLFIRQEEGGLYEKYEETHYQRAYSLDKVGELIKAAGLKLEAVYDAFTLQPPKEESQRVILWPEKSATRENGMRIRRRMRRRRKQYEKPMGKNGCVFCSCF